MALGATPGQVLAETVRNSLRLTLLGIGLGISGALTFASVLRGVVAGISPTDSLTLAAVAALLSAIATAAGAIPAQRATCIDPSIALRQG
jgi:ABC-type antimicrobial peptide transport system permease subunit